MTMSTPAESFIDGVISVGVGGVGAALMPTILIAGGRGGDAVGGGGVVKVGDADNLFCRCLCRR